MITFRFNGDLTAAPAPRGAHCDDLREEISLLTGLSIGVNPRADHEDWTEAALQLREVLRAGIETEITWPSGRERRSALISGEACADAVLGAVPASDEVRDDLCWPLPQNRAAVRYAQTDTFRRHAGRRVVVCDMPGDPAPRGAAAPRDPLSLTEALTRFEGRRAVVKQVLPIKAMPLRFLGVIPEGGAAKAAREVFADDPYHPIRFEGEPGALLVQEEVRMSFETRYFIVDGVPVSGAGCVEAHTPLNRYPALVRGVTHCVFEETRNDGRTVEAPEIGERLEAFVRRMAADLAAEKPNLTHVVMDVALSCRGEPILVEMNPYQNSGLYANDPAAVFNPVINRIRASNDHDIGP